MQFSTFGTKFSQHSGITQLMDDLNDGLQNPDAIMLGGGNPAAIPEMIEHFTHLSQRMVEDGSLVSALTNYDGPQGKSSFISALAKLLSDTYGWPISEKNIMLTNGSQCAFFYLFNLFGGQYDDGSFKKILLPLTPEYIGYAIQAFLPIYSPALNQQSSTSTTASLNTMWTLMRWKLMSQLLLFVRRDQPTLPVMC